MVHWACQTCQEYTIRSRFVAGGCFWRAVFLRTSLLWRVERLRSDNYLHQVVCRLNRCIWYAPCRMLPRNFPRGHFHAGGGGTVSNSVWLCVFFTLINVYLWSSDYKNVTSKSSIIVSRSYNTCSLTSHCIVGPSITVFGMPSKRRRMLLNTNHNYISGTSKCHNVHNDEDTLRKTSRTKYPVALSQNRHILFQGHSFLYHYWFVLNFMLYYLNEHRIWNVVV